MQDHPAGASALNRKRWATSMEAFQGSSVAMDMRKPGASVQMSPSPISGTRFSSQGLTQHNSWSRLSFFFF